MRCIACAELSNTELCYNCKAIIIEVEAQPFVAEMEVTESYEEYN